MKQNNNIVRERYNGSNTPLEELNDDLGNMLIEEYTFSYTGRQFDPRAVEKVKPKTAPKKKSGKIKPRYDVQKFKHDRKV